MLASSLAVSQISPPTSKKSSLRHWGRRCQYLRKHVLYRIVSLRKFGVWRLAIYWICSQLQTCGEDARPHIIQIKVGDEIVHRSQHNVWNNKTAYSQAAEQVAVSYKCPPTYGTRSLRHDQKELFFLRSPLTASLMGAVTRMKKNNPVAHCCSFDYDI